VTEDTLAETLVGFIVGAPRSGTSILKKVLRSRPGINACGVEAGYIFDTVDRFGLDRRHAAAELLAFVESRPFSLGPAGTAAYRAAWGDADVDGAVFLRRYVAASSKPAFASPTILQYPGPGAWRFRELRRIFPRIRFIAICRDPRANVASQLAMFGDRSVIRSIRLWKQCYRGRAECLRECGPDALAVTYERLVTDQDAELRRICGFLGLSPEEEFPAFEVRSPETHAGGAKELKTFTRLETRMMDKWRSSLSPEAVAVIERACRAEMAAEGYAPAAGRVNPLSAACFLAGDAVHHLRLKLRRLRA
jgi:hypothetical protein